MQESVCVYFSRLAINDSRITIVVATTPVLEHTCVYTPAHNYICSTQTQYRTPPSSGQGRC